VTLLFEGLKATNASNENNDEKGNCETQQRNGRKIKKRTKREI
jgi:hypothetical protein